MSNNGWDFDLGSGDGRKVEFTKFPVGVTRIRVIEQVPYIRWTHWLPQFKRSVNCPGKGCPMCEIRRHQKANKESYSYAMGRRIAIQVLNRETKKLEIMEQGVGFFEDLKDLMNDLKDQGLTLLDADIRVRRRGEGKDDTSYRLDIDEKYPLTVEEQDLIKDKVELVEFFKPHTVDQVLQLVQGKTWDEVMKPNQEETQEEDNEEIEIR